MQQNTSIWLIDDDGSTLDIVARAFEREKLSCQLKVYADPNLLISEIGQSSNLPTLLMIDYAMPNMNGLQLIQWLKNNPKTHKLKMVLFSCNITVDIMQKAERLNVYQVTNKPSDFGEWRDLVKELCSAGFFS